MAQVATNIPVRRVNQLNIRRNYCFLYCYSHNLNCVAQILAYYILEDGVNFDMVTRTMTRTGVDSTGIQAEQIASDYIHAFKLVHRQEPRVRYLSNQWFQVNGETVHRLTLIRETERLRDIAQAQRLQATDKGMLQRLIAKLRKM